MDTQLYDILELVGQGSYGHVYKGRINDTGQIVALKFLPKMNRSEKELQNLKQEIDILRRLLHPHIVQLYDSFETETQVVIVTEYAEGQLFKVLQNGGKLRESQIREIACQLVSALYYLHSNRILHRDMKPQNILLGKNGVVKLCDFGYARVMSTSTYVVTSVKGTPLYMSPELVEEKPYDHTVDLWSLGCILYELYTGLPPFYTDSMRTLMKLLTKCSVKWPKTMSDTFQSLLKGLLTKDPEKRLSWPDLLYHPFVSGSVLVLSDANVFSPLTVAPTADMKALKREQVTAKMAQMRARKRYRPPEPVPCRGQISIDYEREFPAVEVGPQLVRETSKNKQTKQLQQEADSELYWKQLAKESDPSKQQKEPLNYTAVISQLKAKILDAFKVQLRDGTVKDAWQIRYPLKVLRNLLQTTELEKSNHLGRELGLPHVFFDLVQDTVKNSLPIKRPWSVSALEEIIVVLMIYWDKYPDWIEEEHRLEQFIEPFVQILRQPDLIPLAPLAASVLSLFTQHDVDVKVDMNNITSLLRNLLLDSFKPTLSLPSGWGICDGPLLLLLETLNKDENQSGASHLDPIVFLDLWEKNATLLTKTTADRDFCSTTGLFYFLSAASFVFSVDPDLCVTLFSKSESKCVYTLGRLLGPDCLHLFSENTCGGREVDLTHDNLSILSCQLLCFPFAMDLPPYTMATILQLYDSCGIVTGLLQLIQTLPAQLLELPLSLLSRLLLCDPEHSVPCIRNHASGLFTPPRSSQLTASTQQSTLTRTASSLLHDLVHVEVNWDSAVELLTLLSLVARFPTQPSCLQLHLEASVLYEALAHSYDQIRIATCRLLGNLDPFRPPTLQPDIFKNLIGCLHDSHLSVRRMACRAVGNWLGYIAARAGFKMGRSNPKHSDTRGSGKQREQNKHKCSHNETAGEEWSRWIHEAHRTAAILPPLITDRDALTRCHSCAALRNLVNVEGAVSLLLEKDVSNLLLRAACTDSHKAVRQAAIATLCLYSEHKSIRQVLISLDASKKLLQASRRAPPQCDYHQLIGKLQPSPADEE